MPGDTEALYPDARSRVPLCRYCPAACFEGIRSEEIVHDAVAPCDLEFNREQSRRRRSSGPALKLRTASPDRGAYSGMGRIRCFTLRWFCVGTGTLHAKMVTKEIYLFGPFL